MDHIRFSLGADRGRGPGSVDRSVADGTGWRSLLNRAHRPVVALALWHLFVWGGRFRNLINEPGPLADANRWSLVGSLFFVGLAVAALATLILGRKPSRLATLPASVLAVAGIAVWSYRAVVIVGRSYSVGFIAVHIALAVVSIALGLWYLRSAAQVR